MKIYKLSLGTKVFSDLDFKLLKSKSLVSLGIYTPPKGRSNTNPFEEFKNANKGDLVYVTRSNNKIEFIAAFTDERVLESIVETKEEEFADKSIKILFEAHNPESYDKGLDKWWAPLNNSTFIEVPEHDFSLFQEKILKPVFSISIQELNKKRIEYLNEEKKSIDHYLNLQKFFRHINFNHELLFKEVNKLDKIELLKIQFSYLYRKNIESLPVVFLRKKLIDVLIDGQEITEEIIRKTKEEIGINFEKDVFKAWTNPFRVLYPLIYDKYKKSLIDFFHDFTVGLQKKLGIENYTKINLVHLDGAQNQGFDRIWFCFYNKTYKSQKLAKQLLFSIDDQYHYGFFDGTDHSKNKMEKMQDFSYEKLLNNFENHKDKVIKDNSIKMAQISNLIELLESKNQIILQGPPGTGKTYLSKLIAKKLIPTFDISKLSDKELLKSFKEGQVLKTQEGYTFNIIEITGSSLKLKIGNDKPYSVAFEQLRNISTIPEKRSGRAYAYGINDYLKDLHFKNHFKIIQFHPSYNYEDFVRGISSQIDNNGKLSYSASNRVLIEIAELAKSYPKERFILIIDEINRANLPSVLGELIYALEYRNEPVESLYEVGGSREITLPDNLYIIGTMNTADRSVGHIDYAIKRRFAFVDVIPNEDVIETEIGKQLFRKVSELFIKEEDGKKVNSEYLASDFDFKDVQLGHSYFMLNSTSDTEQKNELTIRLQYEILPVLKEYVKDGVLLETAKEKLEELENLEL